MVNCYLAIDIMVTKTGGDYAGTLTAAGLIGDFGAGSAGAKIEKSVALNPKILIGTSAATNRAAKRITAGTDTFAVLANNYALSTMPTGDNPGAAAETENTHNDLNGASADAASMNVSSFWAGAPLNFDPAIWDFSNLDIGSGVYPKLKTQI